MPRPASITVGFQALAQNVSWAGARWAGALDHPRATASARFLQLRFNTGKATAAMIAPGGLRCLAIEDDSRWPCGAERKTCYPSASVSVSFVSVSKGLPVVGGSPAARRSDSRAPTTD